MERLLDRLFNTARSYSAKLDGEESVSAESKIDTVYLSVEKPVQVLEVLHQTLREAYPETGASYWRVRCWGLACWQPIYLAMICVYQLKAVPLCLHAIKQKRSGEMIAGYLLADGTWQEGSHETLIKAAGEQLDRMFKLFEKIHVDSFGGKPILYQGLLADQFMNVLIAINHLLPNTQKFPLEKEFRLWAESMNLPLKTLEGLSQQDPRAPVFVRRTCCLHFRRDKGELCDNCPKLHKRSTKITP